MANETDEKVEKLAITLCEAYTNRTFTSQEWAKGIWLVIDEKSKYEWREQAREILALLGFSAVAPAGERRISEKTLEKKETLPEVRARFRKEFSATAEALDHELTLRHTYNMEVCYGYWRVFLKGAGFKGDEPFVPAKDEG